MMPDFTPELNWIDRQHERLCELVGTWSNINSGTYHLAGLDRQCVALADSFAALRGRIEHVALPPHQIVDATGRMIERPLGKALHIAQRPQAPCQVFLGIHMDTVYSEEHPFQSVTPLDANRLRGPGVADAKGGLAIMLIALQALERSPVAPRIGWQVVINPDEEIGSPGSTPLLTDCARRCQVGLVFEPALPDGALIGARPGSGNFTLVVYGRAAHAGRHFHEGRNAIHALARAMVTLSDLTDTRDDLTVNIGKIEGGGPVNMVPDLAICRLNVRVVNADDQRYVDQALRNIVDSINHQDGFRAELHGGFTAPPKPLDPRTLQLLNQLADCGRRIGLDIHWRDSGGVCDGNRLAAAGLPVVDTLGPVGGNLHSSGEYVLLDSLTQRAKLTALFLMRLAEASTGTAA